MLIVRPAKFDDFPAIQQFDQFLGDRRLDLQSGLLSVVENRDKKCIGYMRIGPASFLGWPCLTSLAVRSDFRRTGAGLMLVQNAQSDARYTRLFTTTEPSNRPMRHLIKKAKGWQIGTLEDFNLNGEAESVYRLK